MKSIACARVDGCSGLRRVGGGHDVHGGEVGLGVFGGFGAAVSGGWGVRVSGAGGVMVG